jgi:AcrR family transcriptional regulator
VPSVTRRSRTSRAERRDELRDRLLKAVEAVTADGESYTELSVERLVKEANVSRSTFYVYFEDKGDLLRTWFAAISDEVSEAAAAWWALDAAATRDDLREALAHVVITYRPHTALMAAVYDAASYDAQVRVEVEAMMSSNVAGLRKHIKAGQKAGYVTPDLLADETAAWLTWMAERGFHQLVRAASDEELERLIDAYTDVVWNTLYGFAPSRVK